MFGSEEKARAKHCWILIINIFTCWQIGHFFQNTQFLVPNVTNLFFKAGFPSIQFDNLDTLEDFVHAFDSFVFVFHLFLMKKIIVKLLYLGTLHCILTEKINCYNLYISISWLWNFKDFWQRINILQRNKNSKKYVMNVSFSKIRHDFTNTEVQKLTLQKMVS